MNRAVYNTFLRQTYSANDLYDIATITNCRVAFIDDNDNIVTILPKPYKKI